VEICSNEPDKMSKNNEQEPSLIQAHHPLDYGLFGRAKKRGIKQN
jgi:hypothetical protein